MVDVTQLTNFGDQPYVKLFHRFVPAWKKVHVPSSYAHKLQLLFTIDLDATNDVETLLLTTLMNFRGNLAERATLFALTFFKTDNLALLNNQQMHLEWKMNQFKCISNSQSPEDFFMHEHDVHIS